jgi:hypothetical protein
MHMPKKNPANHPAEKPWPSIPPEENPDELPVNPLSPAEEPDMLPEEKPFETPPYELPEPREGA